MNTVHIPRLVIAAASSGAGKTTIVSGMLASLTRQGHNVTAYKIGPDYIDPSYHQLASGKYCHNLDSWLTPPTVLKNMFITTAGGSELAVIEGVMGLFDGGSQLSSTAAIAKLLGAPVVLVLDVKAMAQSAAAIVYGFQQYDPDLILAGVILNRIGSETHKHMVCQAIEALGIPVLGCLTRNEDIALPERHLGLVQAEEQAPRTRLAAIADQVSRQVDLTAVVALAQAAPPLTAPATARQPVAKTVRIGIARDQAFSFYYPESLAVLEDCGAELTFFSPLADGTLPDVDGLIFGGGYPELYAAQLGRNSTLRSAIANASQAGMPIYAECGGFMYLCRSIQDFDGNCFPMTAIIPATACMQSKLQTVGYIQAVATSDNLLGPAGATLRGHEFHFSTVHPAAAQQFPWAFTLTKARTGATYPGGYACNNVLASYLHIHFAGNPTAAQTFVDHCRRFRHKRQYNSKLETDASP